jgi:hypothetical protein
MIFFHTILLIESTHKKAGNTKNIRVTTNKYARTSRISHAIQMSFDYFNRGTSQFFLEAGELFIILLIEK